jgi:hypothetical protein
LNYQNKQKKLVKQYIIQIENVNRKEKIKMTENGLLRNYSLLMGIEAIAEGHLLVNFHIDIFYLYSAAGKK